MTKNVLYLLGVVALLAACGASDEPDPPAAVAVVETDDATEATTAPAIDKPTVPTVAAQTFDMPELVGANLKHAVDALDGLGATLVERQDATGLEREFVNDTMWTVCAQTPAAGTAVSTFEPVMLLAQKMGEPCP